eukprot:COSAG06_NODE_352_length_16924_cov_168.566615_14_plen_178_part_00
MYDNAESSGCAKCCSSNSESVRSSAAQQLSTTMPGGHQCATDTYGVRVGITGLCVSEGKSIDRRATAVYCPATSRRMHSRKAQQPGSAPPALMPSATEQDCVHPAAGAAAVRPVWAACDPVHTSSTIVLAAVLPKRTRAQSCGAPDPVHHSRLTLTVCSKLAMNHSPICFADTSRGS